MAIFRMHHASFVRPKCLTLRDRLDDDHMTAEVHRRWGSSYPWSRFMAGCPILILMASLTFLFNQMSCLASRPYSNTALGYWLFCGVRAHSVLPQLLVGS